VPELASPFTAKQSVQWINWKISYRDVYFLVRRHKTVRDSELQSTVRCSNAAPSCTRPSFCRPIWRSRRCGIPGRTRLARRCNIARGFLRPRRWICCKWMWHYGRVWKGDGRVTGGMVLECLHILFAVHQLFLLRSGRAVHEEALLISANRFST
jgi:hypothetical protein